VQRTPDKKEIHQIKKMHATEGYLSKDTAAQMIALYSHVMAQGDEPDGTVYGTNSQQHSLYVDLCLLYSKYNVNALGY